MIHALSRAEFRARFGFIQCDRDELLQAGNLEDLVDRGLNPKIARPPLAAAACFAVTKRPEAGGSNQGDFSHVEMIRGFPPLMAEPTADCNP